MAMVIRNKKPGFAYALTPDVRRAITKLNAQYVPVTDIPEKIAAQFGVTISRTVAYRYHPDSSQGVDMDSELLDYFYQCRREFAEELEAVPGSIRAVRVQRLDTVYHMAMKAGDLKAAIAANVALRQEMEKFEVFDDEDDKAWPAAHVEVVQDVTPSGEVPSDGNAEVVDAVEVQS
jgi:hypothetical protein